MLKQVSLEILHGDKTPERLNFRGLVKNRSNCKLYGDGSSLALFCEEGGELTVCIDSADEVFIRGIASQLHGEVTFCGVSRQVFDVLSKFCKFSWVTDCGLFVYDESFPVDFSAASLPPMDPEYWKQISDGTHYKPEERNVRECINRRVSSAYYVNGKPVCWCLLHGENSLGMLYTLPQYRNKGFALAVMKDICRKVIASGDVPYGYIVKGNLASERLAPKYGLHYVRDAIWCGFTAE